MNLQSHKTPNLPNGLTIPLRETPEWCPTTRILKIAGKVVKHFKWPAPNQEMLITAFAELNWPDQIDDPLPQTSVCPKRKLHDTIKCLNRNQVHPLIKFRGDGTGLAARWEFRPPEKEQPKQLDEAVEEEPDNVEVSKSSDTATSMQQTASLHIASPLNDAQSHFG